jgi:2-dehydropantoate 2-reductase
MKVTIVGAGAIGGLAGCYLARAGADVLLVDRWQEHVDAINARGMTVDGVRGDLHFDVRATTPDKLEGPLEAVLVATKSQHTEEAVRQLLPLVGPDTFIVSYQNGFNEPLIADVLTSAGLGGMERVMGSIPNYGGALVDPGHLEFVHEGPIQLGEMDGSNSARLKTLAATLESLTTVAVSNNIWGQIWAKEVYSAQVVFSALADMPIRDTLGDERWARVAGAVVCEALEIADASGIEVEPFDFFDPKNYRVKTPDDTRRLLDNINHAIWLLKKDQLTSTHVFRKKGSGIWWDLVYRNRPSEVRSSNGKLVDYGRAVGADVRLNDKLCSMIYEIERNERTLGTHNFEELEAYAASIGKALP